MQKSVVDRIPFGSEMAWDSTGQEEVYAWCKYFGYDDKALVSLNSIIGYMPALPHWGYNGNARRYWDFLYGGKIRRIERQLHHYGSGLNAIPVLAHYREHPDDEYLLSRADRFTPDARLRLQQPARIATIGTYAPRGRFVMERDAFTIPLGLSAITIELNHRLHR